MAECVEDGNMDNRVVTVPYSLFSGIVGASTKATKLIRNYMAAQDAALNKTGSAAAAKKAVDELKGFLPELDNVNQPCAAILTLETADITLHWKAPISSRILVPAIEYKDFGIKAISKHLFPFFALII